MRMRSGILPPVASITLILFFALRRWTDVALTVVPLLIAIVVTLEICVVIGLQLNIHRPRSVSHTVKFDEVAPRNKRRSARPSMNRRDGPQSLRRAPALQEDRSYGHR